MTLAPTLRDSRATFVGDDRPEAEREMKSTGSWARATAGLGRTRLVRDAGVLVAGSGAAQLALLLCMPAILHIYGARTFGLFSTILAVASVVGALTDQHINAAILFIAPRYRALRRRAG